MDSGDVEVTLTDVPLEPVEGEHKEKLIENERKLFKWTNYLPNKNVVSLYIGHLLSSWGDRVWFFALPISFASMYPTTLLPVTLYQFVTQIACVLFGNYIGYMVDTKSRLPIVRGALIIQNLTLAATAAMIFLLVFTGKDDITPPTEDTYLVWPFRTIISNCLFTASMLFGSISQLASMLTSIALQKDWAIVVAHSHEISLADVNATMRRIDLMCAILSPLGFSLLLMFTSVNIGLLVIACWNVVSLIPEWVCVGITYYRSPALATRTIDEDTVVAKKNLLVILANGWKQFIHQKVLMASIAFILLFFTVLQDGALMISFLKSGGNDIIESDQQTMPDTSLGVFKACCAISGVLATLTSPWLIKKLGVVKGGLTSMWFQFTSLAIGSGFLVLYMLRKDAIWGVYIFMASIVFSRFGLYGFDLAEIQIMQEMVEERERGTVNSTEKSLTKLSELMSYVVAIFLSRPSLFFYFILLSVGTVMIAAMFYSVWTNRYAKIYDEIATKEEDDRQQQQQQELENIEKEIILEEQKETILEEQKETTDH